MTRKAAAFSNGTEWEIWSYNWCDRCLVDAPYRNGISDSGCPLILQVMLGETPPEFIEQDLPPQNALLQGREAAGDR